MEGKKASFIFTTDKFRQLCSEISTWPGSLATEWTTSVRKGSNFFHSSRNPSFTRYRSAESRKWKQCDYVTSTKQSLKPVNECDWATSLDLTTVIILSLLDRPLGVVTEGLRDRGAPDLPTGTSTIAWIMADFQMQTHSTRAWCHNLRHCWIIGVETRLCLWHTAGTMSNILTFYINILQSSLAKLLYFDA